MVVAKKMRQLSTHEHLTIWLVVSVSYSSTVALVVTWPDFYAQSFCFTSCCTTCWLIQTVIIWQLHILLFYYSTLQLVSWPTLPHSYPMFDTNNNFHRFNWQDGLCAHSNKIHFFRDAIQWSGAYLTNTLHTVTRFSSYHYFQICCKNAPVMVIVTTAVA